jgi:hypothetical protein
VKLQEEAKQQLEELTRERQSQEIHPSTSHDNYTSMQVRLVSIFRIFKCAHNPSFHFSYVTEILRSIVDNPSPKIVLEGATAILCVCKTQTSIVYFMIHLLLQPMCNLGLLLFLWSM